MKSILTILLVITHFFFLSYVIFAQSTSGVDCGMAEAGVLHGARNMQRSIASVQLGGQWMTTRDTLHVLVVFVQFPDDNYDTTYFLWPKNQPPSYLNTYIDSTPSQQSTNGNLTHYFRQMSLGAFTLTGKTRFVITPHTRQWYLTNDKKRWLINKEVLETLDATLDFTEFDRWKRYGEYDVRRESDGKVDMIFMIYRDVTDASLLDFYGGEASLGYPRTTGGYNEPIEFSVDGGLHQIGGGHPALFNWATSEKWLGSGTTIIASGTYNGGMGWFGNIPYGSQIHEFSHHWMTIGDWYGHNGDGFWAMLDAWGRRYNSQGISCANSFERELVGWIAPDSIYQTTYNVTLTDYVTTGSAKKIKVPGSNPNEIFRLEYHLRSSQFDTPDMSDINAKGLYILHQTGTDDPFVQIRLLPADGKWNWVADTVMHPSYYPSGLAVYEKSGINRINGYDDSRQAPFTWTGTPPTPNVPNPMLISIFRDRTKSTYPIIDQDPRVFRGDGKDAFTLAKNNVFSPWSNPSSQNGALEKTNIAIEIANEDVQSCVIVLNIYFDSTAALSLPPSKPQDVQAYFNSSNQTVITWTDNIESDVTTGGGYDLYRAVYWDGTTLSYTKVNSSLITTSTFTDIPPVPTGAPNGADVWYRYYIKARDSQNKYSVQSEDFWLYGGRIVVGTISSNTTWNGRYIALNNITINSGVTLSINSGSIISFASGVSLTSNGVLNVNGTSGSPVTFTSVSGTSPGSWGSVKLEGSGTSGSLLNYLSLQYGGDLQFLNGANGTLQNSSIYKCNRGVYIYNSQPEIVNNIIEDNYQDGILCNAASYAPLITDNSIKKTSVNLYNYSGINIGGDITWGYLAHNDIEKFYYGMYIGGGPVCVFDDKDWNYYSANNRITNCLTGISTAWGSSLYMYDDADFYCHNNSIHNNTNYDLQAYQQGTIHSAHNYFGGGNPVTTTSSGGVIYNSNNLTSDPWDVSFAMPAPASVHISTEYENNAEGKTVSAENAVQANGETDDFSAFISGMKFIKKGDFTKASEYYQQTIQAGKISRNILAGLAYSGAQTSDQGVVNYLLSLKNSETVYQAYIMHLLAALYVRQGDMQKSTALFDEIIEKYPNTRDERKALFQKFYQTLHVEKNTQAAGNLFTMLQSKYAADDAEGELLRAQSILNSSNDIPYQQKQVDVDLNNGLLLQNYPNPFNPATTIGFTIQVSGFTTLKIYDVLGREVVTLANEYLEAGVMHHRTFDASRLSSGMYYYALKSGGKQEVKKMLYLK